MKKQENKENKLIESKENTEINPSMDIEVIAEKIKKEEGLKEVFITEIQGADLQLIWKRLSRKDYREILSKEYSEDQEEAFFEKEEEVTRKVLLYPKNVDEIMEEFGAVAELISSEAMIKSGFGIKSTTAV